MHHIDSSPGHHLHFSDVCGAALKFVQRRFNVLYYQHFLARSQTDASQRKHPQRWPSRKIRWYMLGTSGGGWSRLYQPKNRNRTALGSLNPKKGTEMKLTDMQCRNAKPGPKVRKLSDGGGLQLWVQPGGSRQWRLAYKFDRKQKVLAIGPYPLISLAEKRARRATTPSGFC